MRFSDKAIRSVRHWLLTLVALCWAASAQAQAPVNNNGSGLNCGFSRVQEAAFARQPGSKAAYEQFLAQAARLAVQQRGTAGAAPDVTVPVVVHIMFSSTSGLATGITDAQVIDALRVANLDFSKTNPDTISVVPAFVPLVANVGFRFRLAKLDPNGNCTTGITRTLTSNAQVTDDVLLKREIRWDPARYLNVWVVDAIGPAFNVAGGYAYLPCTGGSEDGIVILKSVLGTIGAATGNARSGHTLTHEIGHYFGLPHTWGNSNSVGLPSNCGTDDGIADTPNTIGASGCNLTFSPCTDPGTGQPILSNVQNFMDYATCPNMFTTGQRTVMRATLTLGCRSTLVSAANLAATGTADGFVPPAGGCPLVAIGTDVRRVCANQSGGPRYFVALGNSDALNASTTQVQWAFPGGVPATSTQRVARVSYPTPGLYPVTLTMTPAGGAPVTRTEQNWMQVGGSGTGLTGPVTESFENVSFPNNFGPADLRNWVVDTLRRALEYRWQRVSGGTLVAADGTACLTVPNVAVASTNPSYAYITSPALNLSALQGRPAQLSFRTAWARNPAVGASVNDELLVQYGTDCEVFSNVTGQSYVSSQLQVTGQAAQNGFVPTSAQQWTTITLPLDQQYIGPNTWVRFQFKSNGGNPIYLDQVRIYDASALATSPEALARLAISVYPNPLTAETAVHFTLPTSSTVAISVTDLLGRTAAQVPAKVFGAGPQAIALPGTGRQALAAGVYLVRLTVGEQTFSSKVLVP